MEPVRDCSRLGCAEEPALDEAAASLEAHEKLANLGSFLLGLIAALASSSASSSSCGQAATDHHIWHQENPLVLHW